MSCDCWELNTTMTDEGAFRATVKARDSKTCRHDLGQTQGGQASSLGRSTAGCNKNDRRQCWQRHARQRRRPACTGHEHNTAYSCDRAPSNTTMQDSRLRVLLQSSRRLHTVGRSISRVAPFGATRQQEALSQHVCDVPVALGTATFKHCMLVFLSVWRGHFVVNYRRPRVTSDRCEIISHEASSHACPGDQ